jgi:hypothetical protein
MLDTLMEQFGREHEELIRSDRRRSLPEKDIHVSQIRERLAGARQLLQKIRDSTTRDPRSDLVLNIAGTLYPTTTATLTSEPRSMLAMLFQRPSGLQTDEQGHPYFEDPLFVHILAYLTTGRADIPDLSVEELRRLLVLLDFYMIDSLTEVCTRRLRIGIGDALSEQWLAQLYAMFPLVTFKYSGGVFEVAEIGQFRARRRKQTETPLATTDPDVLNQASQHLAHLGIHSHLARPRYVLRGSCQRSVFLTIFDDDVWHLLGNTAPP